MHPHLNKTNRILFAFRYVQFLGNGQQHLHYDGADHVQQPQRVFSPFRYPPRNDVLIIV